MYRLQRPNILPSIFKFNKNLKKSVKESLIIEDPVNMPLVASTGPILDRCCQHRPSTGPVLAYTGMFMGRGLSVRCENYAWEVLIYFDKLSLDISSAFLLFLYV